MKRYLLWIIMIMMGLSAYAQVSDWNNGGGNPFRNGFADVPGPEKDSVIWEVNSPGFFGLPVYIEGNRLVTMRFLGQANAPVECYDLTNGTLLWSKEVTGGTGRSLPVGFRDGQVYVERFTESLIDSLFALDAATGERLWTCQKTVSVSITNSANFAPNGDLYVESWSWAETMGKLCRIDWQTGDLIWECDFLPPVVGHSEVTIYQNTGYVIENIGGIINITAIDLDSGQRKYSYPLNDNHPGGAIPQCPIMVGFDGTIFFHKQEDNVSAFEDDGTQLNLLWETEIFGNAPFSHMCVGPDNTVYAPSEGKVLRLDHKTGAIMNTSPVICQNPELFQMRASASGNGIIYVTNGENKIYAFTPDLDVIWSDNIPNVNTSGAALGSDGVMAVTGSNVVRVYAPGLSTGVAQPSRDMDLACYPNPAGSTLNIQVNGNDRDINYTITDICGHTVISGKSSSRFIRLDVSQLPAGLYQVNLDSGSKGTKFIKL